MTLGKRIALTVPAIRRLRESRDILLRERDALAEAGDALSRRTGVAESVAAASRSPFFHYNCVFDAEAVIRRHAVADLRPAPGFVTNFLGVVTDPKFFPSILDDAAGQVQPVPIPANWHADIAEWAAALRAVDLARGSFTVVELGCGWGCWMNNAGSAARRAGLSVHLIGIEGDEGHLGFASEATRANGFKPSEVSLHRGIAGAVSGVALFPRQGVAGVSWSLEPILGADEAQRHEAVRTGWYDELPLLSLAEVTSAHPRVDLLHIDIQGGEADLVEGCLTLLGEKVAYVLIGTHSRQIEGRIMRTMLDAGWRLEMERPCIFGLDGAAPATTVDGVQGWRNPALLPA